MKYWLIKSDPETYTFQNLVEDKTTCWDGIRNYAARNFLREMKKNDQVLVYHSGGESSVIGHASVAREHYQDPGTTDPAWLAVDLKAGKALKNPVSLKTIKAEKRLKDIPLIRISRLSVMPLSKEEYEVILELSEK